MSPLLIHTPPPMFIIERKSILAPRMIPPHKESVITVEHAIIHFSSYDDRGLQVIV